VLWYHERRSVTSVQRRFRTSFGKEPPSYHSVLKWYRISQETGCICEGRPSVTETQVDAVRQAYVRSPGNSIRALHSRQLNRSTDYKILREMSKCKSYRYQLLQKVTQPDRESLYAFCSEFFKKRTLNWAKHTLRRLCLVMRQLFIYVKMPVSPTLKYGEVKIRTLFWNVFERALR
jgi:hypothetical protein